MPGVVDVAMADCPPLVACSRVSRIVSHDRPPAAPRHGHRCGTALDHAGLAVARPCPAHPRTHVHARRHRWSRRRVVLVSETMARAFWPGRDPIGRCARASSTADTAYVVGVVGDVLYGAMGLPPRPEVYVSYHQRARSAIG